MQRNKPRRSEVLEIKTCPETETYHIMLRSSDQSLCEGSFETIEHVNQAIQELEERFVFAETLEAETLEAMQELVFQHWCREQVGLELAIALR